MKREVVGIRGEWEGECYSGSGVEWAAERNVGNEGGEEHDYYIICNTQCTMQWLPQYRK